jgi:hypothetical protein
MASVFNTPLNPSQEGSLAFSLWIKGNHRGFWKTLRAFFKIAYVS